MKFIVCFISFAVISVLKVSIANAHADFSEVISEVKPFVVRVEVERKYVRKSSKKDTQRLNEALGKYADYYKDELPPVSRNAFGTGFIIRSSLDLNATYVLTAAHVVRHAKKIHAIIGGNKKEKAKLLWIDTKADVALLAISKNDDLDGLKMSERDIKEGQEVLAISGAFGLSLSSSTGIVSAIGVKLKRRQNYGLIQTDAAVNPGSSGGPLFNSHGEVVGLISNIYSNTGNFSGAAFVVPAEKLIELLEKKGLD